MTVTESPFAAYNLVVGVVAAVGISYLLYVQQYVVEFRRFLYSLLVGFLLFSVGGPLVELYAPAWSHAVHGVAALFVVFALYSPVHNDLRKAEWASLVFRDPTLTRRSLEWMTPMDDDVLELFHSSHLVLTPAIIAYNLEYSRGEVNRHLTRLQEHGLVEKADRGKYRMTAEGERYLRGE